jgi:galactokinase/mevalonate kinase-like predicted kinase
MQKQTVNMQEQIDLQKSSLITPEYVLKTGVVPDASNVQYNQLNDTNMNAADKIQAAKELNAFVIHQQAEALANNDIKKLIKQKEIELQNLKAKETTANNQTTTTKGVK